MLHKLCSFTILRLLVTSAIFLSLLVIVLGAYTRLTDAGLGCPDWPLCYGHIIPHAHIQDIKATQTQSPFIITKAWTEMLHRYVAGLLATLIFCIAALIFLKKVTPKLCYPRRYEVTQDEQKAGEPSREKNALGMPWYQTISNDINLQNIATSWRLPFCLLILVVFQALLGMWTVSLKLLPIVVMGHLLGGILIFATLCCFRLQLSSVKTLYMPVWRVFLLFGCIIVFCQIALGGLVSSNYAGIACIDFPTCNGFWLPNLNFSHIFNTLFTYKRDLNYQGGLLDNSSRVTIQWMHRVGALVTLSYTSVLSTLILIKIKSRTIRFFALLILALVLVQIILGVINVVYVLPLGITIAHNFVAALLMASLLMLFYLSLGRKCALK